MKFAYLVIAVFGVAQGVPQGDRNAPQFTPAWPTQTRAPEQNSGVQMQFEVLAEGLDTPWGMVELPEGGILVTERSGTLRLVQGGMAGAPIAGVPQVLAQRQGGLLESLWPKILQPVTRYTLPTPNRSARACQRRLRRGRC